jgi:hypothetical protein
VSMMTTTHRTTTSSTRHGERGHLRSVARPFRTPVRGHAFAARTPDTADPTPGQLARLIREPANPADGYAVSVWVATSGSRWRIGYLDRTVAARIAPRLDAGVRIAAQLEGWTTEPDGRWRRPLLVLLPDTSDDEPRSEREPVDEPERGAAADRRETERPRRSAPPQLWGRPPGVSRRTLDGGRAR